MEKIKGKFADEQPFVLFVTWKDVEVLMRVCNEIIDKVNEIVDVINKEKENGKEING